MKHPVDPLLPNSRHQAMKQLLHLHEEKSGKENEKKTWQESEGANVSHVSVVATLRTIIADANLKFQNFHRLICQRTTMESVSVKTVNTTDISRTHRMIESEIELSYLP